MSDEAEPRRGLLRLDRSQPDINEQFGPLAWLTRVEGAAGAVLRDAGLPDHLGWFVLTPDGWREMPTKADARPLLVLATQLARHPTESTAEPLSRGWYALRVLTAAEQARDAVARGDALAALEWGARAMEAAQGLNLELAGWPLAAERGAQSKAGEDIAAERTGNAELQRRARRWRDEADALQAQGISNAAATHLIADREGVPFDTVKSALRRERKRRAKRR